MIINKDEETEKISLIKHNQVASLILIATQNYYFDGIKCVKGANDNPHIQKLQKLQKLQIYNTIDTISFFTVEYTIQ